MNSHCYFRVLLKIVPHLKFCQKPDLRLNKTTIFKCGIELNLDDYDKQIFGRISNFFYLKDFWEVCIKKQFAA